MKDTLVILGGGGHAQVVSEVAMDSGAWAKCISYDDTLTRHDSSLFLPVVGGIEEFFMENGFPYGGVIVGIGDNNIRWSIQNRLVKRRINIATLIHPMAYVSSSATIGQGTVVMAGVVVNSQAKIGNCCILNSACTVDHHCLIDNAVHISPGANIGGNVSVGHGSWVGIGSCVRNDIKIGKNAIIAAGSTAVNDIEDGVVAIGIPAKPV